MKRLLLIFIPLLLLASCNDGKKKAAEAASKKTKEDSIAHMKKDSISSLPQNRVGKYVYLDNYGVLHTRLGCVRINYVSSTTKEVRPILLCSQPMLGRDRGSGGHGENSLPYLLLNLFNN